MKHEKLVRPGGSKNKKPRKLGGPMVDLIMKCLFGKELSLAQILDAVSEKMGYTVSDGTAGTVHRLHAGKYKRIYTVRWEYDDLPGRQLPHRIFARGSLPDAPKPARKSSWDREKKRRRNRKEEAATLSSNSSIFALAASLQTSQNRHSAKGSDDVQALP